MLDVVQADAEEWVSDILAAANKFPGYLGSEVLRPSGLGPTATSSAAAPGNVCRQAFGFSERLI